MPYDRPTIALHHAAGAPRRDGCVEVDLDALPAGETLTLHWHGAPVWVTRRAAPADRPCCAGPQRPDVLVATGICTRQGCRPVPVPAGDTVRTPLQVGDGSCPCRGWAFEQAGQLYRNQPAAMRLAVPPHHYASAGRLVIGAPAAH